MVNGYSNAGGFRYGFNGKEKDNEDYGEGNSYDYGYRIYNPRIGKFLSIDPLSEDYPELTPYQFASNRPIEGIDLDGQEFGVANPISDWIWETYLEWKFGDPTGTRTLSTGINDKATIQNNQASYQNSPVPEVTQKRLNAVNENEANSKVVEGSAQMVEFHYETAAQGVFSFIPADEGELVVDVVLNNIKNKIFGKGTQVAGEKAGQIIEEKVAANLIERKATQESEKAIVESGDKIASKKLDNLNNLRQQAVRDAWKEEKELVEETGRGTRDWTKKEMAELKKTGRVKGYEGHHINNVANNKEMGGNPNNIKFVKGRQEHLKEHGGNWKKPTSGKLIERKKASKQDG
mgnify:CR=1 FL=1